MTPFDVLLIFDGVMLVAAACVIFILQRQRITQLQEKRQKTEQACHPAILFCFLLWL